MGDMGRLVRTLLLLLALSALALSVEGKKKKSKKEWNAAWKKLEEEEHEEYEERRAERMAEQAKYQDPMMGAMMGGLAGGNNGGVAMCFVKMKPELTREETEVIVVKWRDLLATAGFDIKPYVVEDQLVLLTLEEQWKVNELKDFVLDPYFAQGKVVSFDYNSKSWYPAGSEEAVKEEALAVSVRPRVRPSFVCRRADLHRCCPCNTGGTRTQTRTGRAGEEIQLAAW